MVSLWNGNASFPAKGTYWPGAASHVFWGRLPTPGSTVLLFAFLTAAQLQLRYAGYVRFGLVACFQRRAAAENSRRKHSIFATVQV